MSSTVSSAARLLAYRLLSEDGVGDLHHSEDGDQFHDHEDEFDHHSEDEFHHSEDNIFHDSHDAAGFGTSGVDAFSDTSGEGDGSSSNKPWGDVILASIFVQAVTVIGLVIATSVRCCGAKKNSKFWTLVTNIIIPSFAGGALLATAIFLIIPEALHLVPLTDTTAAAVAAAASASMTGHDDHSGHEGHEDHDEHEGDHEDEFAVHGDHEGDDHFRFLQEDARQDEPDQPWKVGTAIIGGFLFPILFWIIFPRHGLEECEQCEVLKEEIQATKTFHASLVASQKLKEADAAEDGSTTVRDECDAGCCEHAAHQKSELSVWEEEEDEDDPDIEYHDGYPDNSSSSHAELGAAVTTIPSTTTSKEEHELEKSTASSTTTKKAAVASTATTRKPINWGLACSILVGDFFHNFTDGVFIGSAFLLCNRELAYTIVATTVYHELAQEIADFFLLTNHCHLKEWEALALNFISGFSVLIGALMVLAIDLTDTAKGIVLAISAGVYLHIAGSECVPRAQSKCKKPLDAVAFLLCFIIGVIPIGLVLLNHGHCEADEHEGHGH